MRRATSTSAARSRSRARARAATTIDGGGIDRVIDVPAPNVVTLSSLTITGGRAGNGPDGPPDLLPGARDATGSPGIAGESGGGIRLLGAGMLTVRDTVISGNRSGDGGDGGNAVANDGGVGPNAGFAATGGAGARGGDGGGIDAETGTVVVSNSTIAANMTGNGGDGGLGAGGAGGVGSGTGVGGVGDFGTGGAGGNAGFGAGILAADLTMTASTVSDNTVGHGGSGGIGLGGSGGPAPSTGSSGAIGMGGAGGAAGGGAAIDAGHATIDATTISANVAGLGGTGGHGVGGDGGAASAGPGAPSGGGQGGLGGAGARGVLYATASLTLRNSTVTANGTAGPGPGGAGDGGTGGASGVGQGAGASFGQGGDPGTAGGGAIDAQAITGTLIHDTIVGNAASPGAAGAAGHGGHGGAGSPPGPNGTDSPSLPGKPGAAGGIMFASPTGGPTTSATVIQNTIVAANSGNNCFGTPVDGGHNITFPGATCPGKVADPLLRPLADNGGPTKTIAPLAASPAVDAVPNSGAGCLATDQRGVQRPQGPACDSGAFELAVPVVVAAAPGRLDAPPRPAGRRHGRAEPGSGGRRPHAADADPRLAVADHVRRRPQGRYRKVGGGADGPARDDDPLHAVGAGARRRDGRARVARAARRTDVQAVDERQPPPARVHALHARWPLRDPVADGPDVDALPRANRAHAPVPRHLPPDARRHRCGGQRVGRKAPELPRRRGEVVRAVERRAFLRGRHRYVGVGWPREVVDRPWK